MTLWLEFEILDMKREILLLKDILIFDENILMLKLVGNFTTKVTEKGVTELISRFLSDLM